MKRKINVTKFRTEFHPFTIERLVLSYNEEDVKPPSVMGFTLPPFQRPLCWNVRQQKAFIESIYRGYVIQRQTDLNEMY